MKPFFFQSKRKSHWWGSSWSVLVLGLLSLVASTLMLATGHHKTTPLIFLAIGQLLVPPTIEFCRRLLAAWATTLKHFITRPPKGNDVDAWFIDEVQSFTGGKIFWISGTMSGLVATIAFYASGVFADLDALSNSIARIQVFIAGFVSGCGLVSLVLFGRLLWRLGSGSEFVSLPDDYWFSRCGRILTQIIVLSAIPWTVFSVSVAFGGIPRGVVALLACSAPAVIVFLLVFSLSQVPLHAQMIRIKHDALEAIEKRINEISDRFLNEKDFSVVEALKQHEDIRSYILRRSEWPVSWSNLLISAGSSILSVVPIFIDFVGRK